MKILFATSRIYLPEALGGGERDMDALVRGLQHRGHRVEVVSSLAPGLRLLAYRARRLLSGRRSLAARDLRNGYPTYRAWHWLVPDLLLARLKTFQPDLVVSQVEADYDIAHTAVQMGVPTLLRFISAGILKWPSRPVDNGLLTLTSNSTFLQERVQRDLGRSSEVLFPIVDRHQYAVARRRAEFVTLINPVPAKGVDLALAMAALLPHRRFLFVESWRLTPNQRRTLRGQLTKHPNVRLRRSTLDMRRIYARTALLLVPSVCEEAFGRVVLEAHASGIPVLAREIGGLPEALGDGGRLMARNASAREWADCVEKMLDDQDTYELHSKRAYENAAP
jgi:glycosyltransferase involved in cell wall biosynthesis